MHLYGSSWQVAKSQSSSNLDGRNLRLPYHFRTCTYFDIPSTYCPLKSNIFVVLYKFDELRNTTLRCVCIKNSKGDCNTIWAFPSMFIRVTALNSTTGFYSQISFLTSVDPTSTPVKLAGIRDEPRRFHWLSNFELIWSIHPSIVSLLNQHDSQPTNKI
jgi:hypothetical protein